MCSSRVVDYRMLAIHFNLWVAPFKIGCPVVIIGANIVRLSFVKENLRSFDIPHVISEAILHPIVREKVNVIDLNFGLVRI